MCVCVCILVIRSVKEEIQKHMKIFTKYDYAANHSFVSLAMVFRKDLLNFLAYINAYIWSLKESESEVAQSCLTLCDPVDCSLPGSSVHGILQARILEWVVISFSSKNTGVGCYFLLQGSSQPRD